MLLGPTGSPGCADSPCAAYPFSGFENPANKYGSVTICDWDCCLYGAGISGDSVTVPGYGTLTSPSSWTSPETCCDSGSTCGDGTNCETVCGPGFTAKQVCECQNPTGRVDGHITYTAINNCYAVVTEGAGDPLISQPIGTFVTIASIQDTLAGVGAVQSDQYAFYSIINDSCGNGDGSQIFLVLGTPSPDNT